MVAWWIPRSYLAQTDADSSDYITSFLEGDIPNLGFAVPAVQMRRFRFMLVHYHGQIFKGSELTRSFELSDQPVRK
jgi:predicted AAA+ superfamily ATPase